MNFDIEPISNLGMHQDEAISKSGEERRGEALTHAFENLNIRITPVNDNTGLVVTNEKGTKLCSDEIMGIYLGSCQTPTDIVVFTTGGPMWNSAKDGYLTGKHTDAIYDIYVDENNDVKVKRLYYGYLGFDVAHPIETLFFYEQESILKVYWLDGVNPNRFINIKDEDLPIEADFVDIYKWNDEEGSSDSCFDFQGHINKVPQVTIEKNYNESGYFTAGTIQYFLSYYNKFGTETNICWQSDIQYISKSDRGGKADEDCLLGFDFKITNVDTSYDYVRIYAVYRSSDADQGTGLIVDDLLIDPTKDETQVLTYNDLNQNHTAIDVTAINFIGGLNIIASTFAQRKNTLFLGDITIPKQALFDEAVQEVVDSFRSEQRVGWTQWNRLIQKSSLISWELKDTTEQTNSGTYFYNQEINNSARQTAGFKRGEVYRFALQLQNINGTWSNPYWLGDSMCTLAPTEGETQYQQNAVTSEFNEVTYYAYENSDGDIYWVKDDTVYVFIRDGQEDYQDLFMDDSGELLVSSVALSTLSQVFEEDTNTVTKAPYYQVPTVVFDFKTLKNKINDGTFDKKYTAYRLLMALTDATTRCIVCQGVINPTMFNLQDRYYNRPYAIGSWIFRPRFSNLVNRHYAAMYEQTKKYAEIQGITDRPIPGIKREDGNWNGYALAIQGASGDSRRQFGFCLIIFKAEVDSDTTYTGAEIDVDDYTETETGNFNGIKITKSKVVSQHTYYRKHGDSIGSSFLKDIVHDWNANVKKKVDDVEYPVLCPFNKGNLPCTAHLVRLICEHGPSKWKVILTAVAAIILAAAAICIAIFTYGTGTAVSVALINTAWGMLASLAATSAVACASYSIAEGTMTNLTDECDKMMAGKGFYPLCGAKDKSYRTVIGNYLSEFILENTENIKDTVILQNSPTIYTYIPQTSRLSWKSKGNAYAMGGHFSFVTAEEEELQDKSQTFYVDESLVTLNSPDISGYTTDSATQNIVLNGADSLGLTITGIIPVLAVLSDYLMQTDTAGLANGAQVLNQYKISNPVYTDDINGLVNDGLYQDAKYTITTKDVEINSAEMTRWATYMWHRDTSYSGFNSVLKFIDWAGNTVEDAFARPKQKIFSNVRFSGNTIYGKPYRFAIESTALFKSDLMEPLKIEYNGAEYIYYGNVDTLSVALKNYQLTYRSDTQLVSTLPVGVDEIVYSTTEEKEGSGDKEEIGMQDPVSIRYKETPHAVLSIERTNPQKMTILPYIYGEDKLSLCSLYGESKLIGGWNPSVLFGRKHRERLIYNIDGAAISSIDDLILGNEFSQVQYTDYDSEKLPYLFVGELYKKGWDYDTWYGGYSLDALENIKWIPCSEMVSVDTEKVGIDEDGKGHTWGDCYYQRWDCLKTYPFAESEEKNSIIEVLSFMVETYINIDGRSDVNRGTWNQLALTPTNTNLINSAYSQKDNFFSFSIQDEKFLIDERYANMVVWSETKAASDDIDKWVNLVASSYIYLSGEYGSITKIVNINDSLVAFQDKAISTIDYDQRAAMQTEEGLPVVLGNTGKVTGYSVITNTAGCQNKWSITMQPQLTFIDDLNKKLFVMSKDRFDDYGAALYFSHWFKEHTYNDYWHPESENSPYSKALRADFDAITGDTYYHNKDLCLTLNSQIGTFTSFMTYPNATLFANLLGKSIVLQLDRSKKLLNGLLYPVNRVKTYEMFLGDYDTLFGKKVDYYMDFRINPAPYSDNIFTNYSYVADWVYPDVKLDGYYQFSGGSVATTETDKRNEIIYSSKSFDEVEAWNEYQHGIVYPNAVRRPKYYGMHMNSARDRYRIWHGDIPKDKEGMEGGPKYHLDRIRNPWIHLKFKRSGDGTKMTFHNLTVTYMR